MKLAYFCDLLICIGSSAGVTFPWAVPRVTKVKRKDTASKIAASQRVYEVHIEEIKGKENKKNGNETEVRSLQVPNLWDGHYRKRPSL